MSESASLITGQDMVVSIPPDHNILVVKVENHKWLSVLHQGQEIVQENSGEPIISFSLSPGVYTLRTDGKIKDLSTRYDKLMPSPFDRSWGADERALLRLSTDAPDRHIIDGIGEIPADGVSYCTITVQKIGLDGQPLTEEKHQDEIFLRTTGGILMDSQGNKQIRSLRLKGGQASFRLVAENHPKIVTVTVFGQHPLLSKAEIQTEFVFSEGP